MISSTPIHGDGAGDRAQLGADHVAERAAVAPRGEEQDSHVLHRAGEHDAGQDPQRAGQVAHLRGQHRPDQRAGAGDGGEVVAEQHVPVGRHVVEAVVVPVRPASAASGRRRSTLLAMNSA